MYMPQKCSGVYLKISLVITLYNGCVCVMFCGVKYAVFMYTVATLGMYLSIIIYISTLQKHTTHLCRCMCPYARDDPGDSSYSLIASCSSIAFYEVCVTMGFCTGRE